MTDNTQESPLHVIELRVDNVKRIRSVRIRPDGSLVVIGGRNAQGKSSTLDALEMALAGAKSIPQEPLRRGARKGKITVDLGEIVVEREITPKGTTLVVKNAQGTPQKSPQGLIDSLCDKLTWDPVAFTRMEPKKQDELLKRALGLDFSQLDEDRQTLFDERTQVNRDVKRLSAQLEALPPPKAGLPAEELSAAELVAELDEMRETKEANDKERAGLEEIKGERDDNDSEAEGVEATIKELEEQLADKRKELEALATVRADIEKRIAAEVERLKALVDPDPEPVRKQLAQLEETNSAIRAKKEREQLEAELAAADERSKALTEAIADVDDQKREKLARAKFPVEGLGFDEVGPTLNGFPLEDASQAEKLRLAVALGAALHPRVRVMLVREGSVLDQEGLQLLAELAQETGSQVFVERVGDGDESAVIIEDGMVLEREGEKGAAE